MILHDEGQTRHILEFIFSECAYNIIVSVCKRYNEKAPLFRLDIILRGYNYKRASRVTCRR